jgi:putative ABC transport system permease protein
MGKHRKQPLPPPWADKLLEWLCPDNLLEEVQGDLQELFEERVQEVGEKRAGREYVLSVLGYMRPWAFKRKINHTSKPLYMDMIRSYITISLRNLRSQKVSSFINIFGLAIGMACCMLIGLYIREESSYDQHWQDSEQLYRVANEVFAGDSHVKSATLAAPIAPVLGQEFPEIEAVARLLPPPDVSKSTFQIIDNGETQPPFFISKGFMADATFFQVFSYQFLYGNPLTALKEPNSVVLSEEVAQKLFGKANPLNKTLRIGNNYGENDYRSNRCVSI